MKKSNSREIDQLLESEYKKCLDNQEQAMQSKKPSVNKQNSTNFMNRDSEQKAGSIAYHLDGKEDIKIFKNSYNQVFVDKERQSRK